MPLNSFEGPSFPIRHSSWTVLTALLWLHCQLLLSCGVAFDMIVERCQKFGGLTLGRKPNTNKTRNKRNKTYCKSEAPWKWNRLCYMSILFNSLNLDNVCWSWPAYIAKNCCASRLHDDKLKYDHPMNVYASKKSVYKLISMKQMRD